MTRIAVICTFCLLLVMPAAAQESSAPEGLFADLWANLVETLSLDDSENAQPSAADSSGSCAAGEDEGVGPAIVPNG